MKQTPVHIITGFLGAGKTTFLNHFIKALLPERIMVIENECGETNIDGGLIMDGVEEIVELSAGCLCCSLSDGLLDVLSEASKRQDQYDRLVIETTGIADPSSIIQVFLEDPRVEKYFHLEQVICLTDAGLLEEWLRETDEALRQVALADAILINKIDMVSQTAVPKVQALVENINPHAVIFTGKQGVFPVPEIMKTGTTKLRQMEDKPHHFHHDHAHEHNHDHQHDHKHNAHGITSFTLTFPFPLNLDNLSLDLTRIVNLYRHQVYRVKGIIALPQYPNRVVLQSARSTFVITDGDPWKEGEKREGKLVFIGRGLKKGAFEKIFNRHIVFPAQSSLEKR
ncbi:CobW family GTP-binding protein [Flexithrix dorotheae]|uniref:CobW family GTP-binding protein n=1 Tax=Flexithrix dorotheae TaxID=70993 RepID=UPI000380B397|nr:GTP-binding protein [Flexithrix dorotheae]